MSLKAGAGRVRLIFLFLLLPGRARAAVPPYATNQSAVAAIGQQDLASSGINGTSGVAASGLSLAGAANAPSGVWSDGTLLIVADAANNRVLIYDTVPTADNAPADVVVGQPDAGSSAANQGGSPAANTLSGPTGVFYDGTRLYIADRGNNRVLIFNALPQSDDIAADVVVGQANFGSNAANTGGVKANTMSSPSAVYSDGTALYAADQGNNRVLIFSAVPAANNASANFVVGQSAFTANSANQGGSAGPKTLSSPAGVHADGASLYVADSSNNRVLIYTPIPAASDPSASVVVGQTLLSSSTANQGGSVKLNTLSAPAAAYSDGASLYVADANNNRLLIFSPIPAANNAAASFVVGQATFTQNAANQGGAAPAANTLSHPAGVFTDGATPALYVADQSNNRVLIFTPVPAGNGASASVAAGQANKTTGTPNQASTVPGANTLFRPGFVFSDRAKLYVADRSNNRVLIYHSFPSVSGAPADVVVGQVSMSSGSSNQGGATGASTLFSPQGVCSDGSKLFVADRFNSRVLIYNSIPSANGTAANVVVGQANMGARRINQGGSPAANTLSLPASVFSDGTRLYVADANNSRVLIYNPVPSSNNAAASVVVGQVSLSTGASNQGAGPTANSLSFPQAVFSDGARLFIADTGNHRVLIYNSIPASNNAAASVVVGQAAMTSNLLNQGGAPRANTLFSPTGVFSDGTRLFVADSNNNRVLIYNSIPAANNAAASYVLGQAAFTSRAPNQGASPAPNALSVPNSVWVDSTTGRLFISESNNNRVLLDLPAISAPFGVAGASVTLDTPLEPAQARVDAPAGAFGQSVNLILGAVASFPAAASPAGLLIASGVGVQASLDQPVQPARSVALTVTYNPADVAALDASKLILARYDPLGGLWTPLVSSSDAPNHRVVAQTDHLSLFQIMQVDTSANTVSSVRVFPNPLLPTQGQSMMTFSSLPANARVRLYNLSGVLIKDLFADETGIARWDATNQSGVAVASGVYFAFAQGGGQSRTFKVAVQR